VIFIDQAKKMKCICILLVQTIQIRIEENPFESVPESSSSFWSSNICNAFELHGERKLARVNVLHVLDSLQTKGFFIQMPPEGFINPNGRTRGFAWCLKLSAIWSPCYLT
jgi:uncharacterized protein YcgL (UPF0745 family)